MFAAVHAGKLLIQTFMEVFADGHQFFFGGQHEALARVRRAALDAPAPHVEDHCRDEHAAEHGRNDTRQLYH